jgi:hypothetical protein
MRKAVFFKRTPNLQYPGLLLCHNFDEFILQFYIITVLFGILVIYVGRDRAVGISTALRAGMSGDRISVGGEIFRTRPDQPWGPPSPLSNEYRVFRGVKRPGVALTTHLCMAPRLKEE